MKFVFVAILFLGMSPSVFADIIPNQYVCTCSTTGFADTYTFTANPPSLVINNGTAHTTYKDGEVTVTSTPVGTLIAVDAQNKQSTSFLLPEISQHFPGQEGYFRTVIIHGDLQGNIGSLAGVRNSYSSASVNCTAK